jgi:hypothetical protein
MHGHLALAMAAGLLLAACADQTGPIRVEVEGGARGDDYGPAPGSYVASMDADQSSTINSDEFNTAFQEADDDMDGKLDLSELRDAVCGSGTAGGG